MQQPGTCKAVPNADGPGFDFIGGRLRQLNGPRHLGLTADPIVRNEFKYDLFRSDVPEITRTIERDYEEIERPAPTTLTLFFYSTELGAPEVERCFRLRTYAQLDDPLSATLDDLKTLTWQLERKHGRTKERLATIAGLPKSIDPDHEEWDVNGTIFRPNLLKVTQRRHFALAQNQDESQRMTVDLSREVFKIGERLQPLGDMGPRVEVKLPVGKREDAVPMAGRLRAAGHWTPFGGLANYFQFLLRRLLPMETHASLPEIESKHSLASGNPQQAFHRLDEWLGTKRHNWRPLLPFPHGIARVRRYHVCEGPRLGSTATVVETTAGRCSLKIKDDARQQGSALLRQTAASHTTDLDGTVLAPGDFIRAHGLNKLNEFTKFQRKIPVALANGHSFQFSLDQCTDPAGHRLAQVEIEFIGSTDGRVAPVGQVLEELEGIARELRASPIGPALEPTHVSKHEYFSRVC